MFLVDTHCHLDFDDFDPDREMIMHRARQAGVVRIVNPGIDIESSQVALRLSETYPEVFVAVGVHPNSGSTWTDQTLPRLRRLAAHPKVIAIGEIGLDYYRDRVARPLQQDILRQQLALAAELGLPVILHSRKAEVEIVDILSEWVADLVASGSSLTGRPGVLHSYSGDEETARKVTALNFFIGITGPVTFHNAAKLQHLVTALPLESLLLETDAPFLTPHPHRGQRNEPAYVRLVAEKIAEQHKQPLEAVARASTANAARLFAWRELD
jgi:TatD DNase family protein